MKLIYNIENCRVSANRVGKRSIRFNSVTGNMYLSTKLAKELNITMNDLWNLPMTRITSKSGICIRRRTSRGFRCSSIEAEPV